MSWRSENFSPGLMKGSDMHVGLYSRLQRRWEPNLNKSAWYVTQQYIALTTFVQNEHEMLVWRFFFQIFFDSSTARALVRSQYCGR